jgi:hypothetical protein
MFLETDIWNVTSGPDPEGQRTRINATDIDTHIAWTTEFSATLNNGSIFFMETGFNGNGNMDWVGNEVTVQAENCPDSANVDDPIGPSQNLEWLKPLGTGVNSWIPNAAYIWPMSCILLDPLAEYFQNHANRDAFAWISHTFTHEDLENSTYYDTNLQMYFNYLHAVNLGLSTAEKWSNRSFIPPGITGLHNGDAIKAFMDNGILAGVGDNTRPVLMNPINSHWPLITTVAGNGYPGFTIIPRWATRFYYNVYVSLNDVLISGVISMRVQMNGVHCPLPKQLRVLVIFMLSSHMKNKCKLEISSVYHEVQPSESQLIFSGFHVPSNQSPCSRCLADHNQRRHQTTFALHDVGRNHRNTIRFPVRLALDQSQGRRSHHRVSTAHGQRHV